MALGYAQYLVIDVSGRQETVSILNDPGFKTGRDLRLAVARTFGIPDIGLKLHIYGDTKIVEPLYTLVENGVSSGMVIGLTRCEDPGRSDGSEFCCFICRTSLPEQVYKVVPACSTCYFSNRGAVDDFIQRARQVQSLGASA